MTIPKDASFPSGPVKVGKYTVTIDRDLCIGAATCLALAVKAFNLDSLNKAIILNTAEEETIEAIIDAAKGCPTTAISITDENGQKVYPR